MSFTLLFARGADDRILATMATRLYHLILNHTKRDSPFSSSLSQGMEMEQKILPLKPEPEMKPLQGFEKEDTPMETDLPHHPKIGPLFSNTGHLLPVDQEAQRGKEKVKSEVPSSEAEPKENIKESNPPSLPSNDFGLLPGLPSVLRPELEEYHRTGWDEGSRSEGAR